MLSYSMMNDRGGAGDFDSRHPEHPENPLNVLGTEVDRLRAALREADELVSKAHDIVWGSYPEWEGEHGRREPLNAAMWELHEHLRGALEHYSDTVTADQDSRE